MKEIPLLEYYEVCGSTFPITRKTGQFSGKDSRDSYLFVRNDGFEEKEFTITPNVHVTEDIGAVVGQRVTMALFEQRGFFLLFNHATSQYKYYPAAVDDLFESIVRDDTAFKMQRQVQKTLRAETESFRKSITFLRTLDKVRLL